MKKINYIKTKYFLYVLGLICIITTQGISQLSLNNGNQTLTITTGIPDGQLTPVVNTTATLSYNRPAATARITVSTACAGQSFNLSVVAINVTKGTAQPAITLVSGGPAMNLITNILRNPNTGFPGTCRLQFTASATFDQGASSGTGGVGNDSHIITYTYLYP